MKGSQGLPSLPVRFARFNIVCGLGIAVGIIVLHLLHKELNLPTRDANGLAIVLASAWNYLLANRWGWQLMVKV